MILVVDNYDSFTFNLVQALEVGGAAVRVVRNDALDAADLEEIAADPAAGLRGIVVSPGPSDPEHAGISIEAVRLAARRRLPLLGVCLGMQALGAAFGARIVRAPTLVHGEASPIEHDGEGLLAAMPPRFMAARYHSLCVDPATLPGDLVATAWSTTDGVLMGVRHSALPLEGVQFHPESVLTPEGPRLLASFLRLAREADPELLLAVGDGFATQGLVDRGDASPAAAAAAAARGGAR